MSHHKRGVKARISFEHLSRPYSSNGGEPKYSCTILIPKTDTATYNDLLSALQTAYEQGVNDKWKGSRPQLRYPVITMATALDLQGKPLAQSARDIGL
ncbi:MAG: DUF2815 family protein [Anaerotignum propionicum]|nr:DUF2815 family protein [Anaerotignum propionicum]